MSKEQFKKLNRQQRRAILSKKKSAPIRFLSKSQMRSAEAETFMSVKIADIKKRYVA